MSNFLTDPTAIDTWLTITDVIVGLALICLGLFGILFLYQWFTRKSFRKIDPELRWALVPLALMFITFIIFEKIWVVDVRPNGSGEPSFPSTHTMLAATVFFITIVALPRYLRDKKLRIVIDILMIAAVILVAVGRVLANMHWPTDVVAGILFSAIFAIIYELILRRVDPTHQILRSNQSSLAHQNKPKHHPKHSKSTKTTLDSKGVAHLKDDAKPSETIKKSS